MRMLDVVRSCAALGLGLVCFVSTAASAEDPRKREPAGWDIRLAPPGEPGEPFEMSGTVRDASGKLLPGAVLFVYHADARGQYTTGRDQPLHLAATLRADEKGRYRIRSVFPGGYGGFHAHVHYEFLAPLLGAGEIQVRREGSEGRSSELAVPRGKDGVWRLNVNIAPSRRYDSNGNVGASAASRGDILSKAAIDSSLWSARPAARGDTVPAPR